MEVGGGEKEKRELLYLQVFNVGACRSQQDGGDNGPILWGYLKKRVMGAEGRRCFENQ